jgi:hypothetical protein
MLFFCFYIRCCKFYESPLIQTQNATDYVRGHLAIPIRFDITNHVNLWDTMFVTSIYFKKGFAIPKQERKNCVNVLQHEIINNKSFNGICFTAS